MPKKTRRQKIKAAGRQAIQPQSFRHVVEEGKLHVSSPLTQETLSPAEQTTVVFFKKDLVRSLIFTLFIIGLEISLYFASIKQYLRLGN